MDTRARRPPTSSRLALTRWISTRSIALAAALPLLDGAATAQQPSAYPSVLSYRTEQVADGVYAFITPLERTGFQSGNSIVVIGDDGVLVFDTGNIPGSTRRQIAEIRKLTDKPVRYVVNSHWHPDHNLGNFEYQKAFPGVTIIGTSATRAGILERLRGYQSQIREYRTTDSLQLVRLATGRMRDGSPMSDTVRVMWTLITRDYGEFAPEVLSATPVPPELLVDDSVAIQLGARRVILVRPGRANTAGDLYAVIPDAHVLLTGDLVTQPCPFPGTAFFSGWIAALDRLKALNAQSIVPGHGEVMHDYTYIDLVRELLVWTRQESLAAAREGISADSLGNRLDWATWEKRFGAGDLVRTESFRNFYRFAALPRAFTEAELDVESPIPRVKP